MLQKKKQLAVGVLSPIVWNLIVDQFLCKYEEGPIKVLGYADDILLYVTGICPVTMGEVLQPALDEVIQWGRNNGLTFNPTKTNAVLFRRFTRVRASPSINLDGMALKLQDSFKYLGVEIHRSLNWLPHVNQRTSKCNSLLGKCRNIIGQQWGLTPSRMEWLFRAVIQPKITYGSIVWSSNLTMTMKKKLTRTQRLCLLSFIHPLRSAPTAGLEAMMGWLPLPLHAEAVGFNTFLRVKMQLKEEWGSGNNGHVAAWERKEVQHFGGSLPAMRPINKHVWYENVDDYSSPERDVLHIYTDASKQGDNIGYAWVACAGNYIIAECIYSAKEVDVHRAEMLAIKEALSWIKEIESINCSFRLISDSWSAISVLKGFEAKDPLTFETMTLLSNIKSLVQLVWTKGHSNNTGNEYADALARVGAKEAERISFSSPFSPLTQRALRHLSEACFINDWQIVWDNAIDYRVSKLFIPCVEKKKVTKMNSEELQFLSQIITGHGLFRRHLRHWNEIEDISCSLCGEADEDSWHLWEYCPSLNSERDTATFLIKNGIPWYNALIHFFRSEKIKGRSLGIECNEDRLRNSECRPTKLKRDRKKLQLVRFAHCSKFDSFKVT